MTTEEIAEKNDYNLNISRYACTSEEEIDLAERHPFGFSPLPLSKPNS